MKKSQLRKIIREVIIESLDKKLLNENITCQCYAGSTQMTCWDYNSYGACCNHYYVHNSKCCPVSQGGEGHTAHPMCNDMHCGNLANTTCFDNVVGPGGGGHDNLSKTTSFINPDSGLTNRGKEHTPTVDSVLTFEPVKGKVKSKKPTLNKER